MMSGKGWGDMMALLVLRPGPLRDGLNALLSSMPEIRLVAQAEDADAALAFLARHCADLALIMSEAGDRQCMETVLEMKALCPQTQVVVLVEDERDRQVAEACGADLVMMLGVPVPTLKAKTRALVRSVAEVA
jgi:DNA-binding NarL/FixJ family response regulator